VHFRFFILKYRPLIPNSKKIIMEFMMYHDLAYDVLNLGHFGLPGADWIKLLISPSVVAEKFYYG